MFHRETKAEHLEPELEGRAILDGYGDVGADLALDREECTSQVLVDPTVDLDG